MGWRHEARNYPQRVHPNVHEGARSGFSKQKNILDRLAEPLGEKCLLQINLNSSATAKSIITEMYAGGADMSDFGNAGITYKQRLNDFLRDFGLEWSR